VTGLGNVRIRKNKNQHNKSTHSPIKRNVLQHKINTKTKARFSRLLRHTAWKWSGPILVLALHKFVTYLDTYPLTRNPGPHGAHVKNMPLILWKSNKRKRSRMQVHLQNCAEAEMVIVFTVRHTNNNVFLGNYVDSSLSSVSTKKETFCHICCCVVFIITWFAHGWHIWQMAQCHSAEHGLALSTDFSQKPQLPRSKTTCGLGQKQYQCYMLQTTQCTEQY